MTSNFKCLEESGDVELNQILQKYVGRNVSQPPKRCMCGAAMFPPANNSGNRDDTFRPNLLYSATSASVRFTSNNPIGHVPTYRTLGSISNRCDVSRHFGHMDLTSASVQHAPANDRLYISGYGLHCPTTCWNCEKMYIEDKFTPFLELPTELRLKIWELALPPPRVIKVSARVEVTDPEANLLYLKFKSDNYRATPLLKACPESRHVALENLNGVLPAGRRGFIRYRRDRDTLFVENFSGMMRDLEHEDRRSYDLLSNPRAIHVKKLVIPSSCFPSQMPAAVTQNMVFPFVGVETIVRVSGLGIYNMDWVDGATRAYGELWMKRMVEEAKRADGTEKECRVYNFEPVAIPSWFRRENGLQY